MPDWLTVIARPFPSAVLVVIHGPAPIVIDPGSLTDADVLPGLLADEAGVGPDAVATVVCTHYHSDHVGAVGALQATSAQVAAHEWDAELANSRDPRVCAAPWLDQPVLPYTVDRALNEGDVVSSGAVELEVVHTPGHTLGGISLWEPRTRTLVCGDALHADDTPWLGNPHEGEDSLATAARTLDRIEQLNPSMVVSGHGPVITDLATAVTRTRERFARWAADPSARVMHAAKRILTYRLMLEPLPSDRVREYLTNDVPWTRDLSAQIDTDAHTFADRLLDALAPTLADDNGMLRTTALHRRASAPIPWQYADPRQWPDPASRG